MKKLQDMEQLGVIAETTLGEAMATYRDKMLATGGTWNVDNLYRKLTGQLEGRSGFDPNLPLHRLTTLLADQWKTKRLLEKAATGTINNEIVFLIASYNLARKTGYRVDPGFECSKFEDVVKLRFLTEDEEERFLSELDPDKPIKWTDRFGNTGTTTKISPMLYRQRRDAYDLAVFLLDTGARYSEVSSIPWSGCIDTDRWETVAIYRWKVKNYGHLVMTDRLREVLQRRLRASNSEYVFPGFGDEADDEDKPRGRSTKAMRRALDRAGCNTPALVKRFGRATAHSLRDTFATRLRREGVQLDELKALLGHSDIEMTERYAHLDGMEVSNNAAAILNRVAKARRDRKVA
jgi:integrase